MRLIKISSFAAALGFICILISMLTAHRLEEAKAYSYPESIGRHYARVSNHVFEGGSFGSGQATEFKKSIAVDGTNPVDTVEIESTSINIDLLPSENDTVDVNLVSNKVDPKEPVLIDSSRGSALRILAQENVKDSFRRGWFVFNFNNEGDEHEIKRNVLQVRIPKSIKKVEIRTTSGDGLLSTAVTSLHFQSKSGDFKIQTSHNPLARVENLNVETVSGSFRGPGRFDHLRFNSVSGDLRLTSFDRVLELDAQTISGDLVVHSSEVLDADVTYATQSGQLHVSRAVSGGKRILHDSDDKKNAHFTIGKGTARIKLQSVSGDLRLQGASQEGSEDEGGKKRHHRDEEEDDQDSNDDDAMLERPNGNSRFVVQTKVGDESFLSCVARLAISEDTRIGRTSVRACVKLIADDGANAIAAV